MAKACGVHEIRNSPSVQDKIIQKSRMHCSNVESLCRRRCYFALSSTMASPARKELARLMDPLLGLAVLEEFSNIIESVDQSLYEDFETVEGAHNPLRSSELSN